MTPRLRFDFDGRTLHFRRPLRVIEAATVAEVVPALAAVESAARAGHWAAGWVAYEAAPAFDAALEVRAGGTLPLLWFGVFEAPSTGDSPAAPVPPPRAPPGPADFAPALSRATYDAAVATIRDAIGRGNVYQVNYTMPLRAAAATATFDYEQLLRAQEPGYGALLDVDGVRILSLSPELFFRRRGREIVTRPMKGTARRGRWLEEDEAAAARLAASEKERAENLMIVDLMRNDLGRVARFGSVHVPRLFEIEQYPTVHQMTSTIAASLRDGVALPELFAALFPCGSVTGAPKVAAMRTIAALEREPRGVYCGTVGLVEPGGDCTFAVAIRTLQVDQARGAATYGVGGGITWDSSAGAEHDEALAKAAVLHTDRPAFELLETMRLEGGRYARLDRHLARAAASARYFGFRFDRAAVLTELEQAAHGRAGAWRVRLLLARDGAAAVELIPIGSDDAAALDAAAPPSADRQPPPLRGVLAAQPVSSLDVFLFHKTTHRVTYDARAAAHPEADAVLLCNERGELTEFTIGNLVLDVAGARLTPPRGAGLLAGAFREAALARGALHERPLTRRDLARASRCWLINSVRGWVPVVVDVDAPAGVPGTVAVAAGGCVDNRNGQNSSVATQ